MSGDNERAGRVSYNIILIYMVFLTIYLLGNRISVTMTAGDMISEFMLSVTKVIELYRIMIYGGALVFFIILYRARRSLLSPDIIILGAFFVSVIISVVANTDLGFKENAAETAKMVLMISLFYLMYRGMSVSEWEHMWKRIIFFACYVWDIGCMISIVEYLINYSGYYSFPGFNKPCRQGITDGRLFGAFSDPNYAAFVSLLLLFGMLWLYKRVDIKILRIGLCISAVINICYMVLSGSRSTMVTVICVVFITVAIYVIKKIRSDSIDIKKAVVLFIKRFIVALIALVVLYFGILYLFKGVGLLIVSERDSDTEFMRDDVSAENISNSRFRIWVDYLTLTKDRPVFGFSIRGALPYSDMVDEDSYLSDRRYNPHSMYILLFVMSGAVGTITMLIYAVYMIWLSVKSFRQYMIKSDISSRYHITPFFILGFFWVVSNLVFNVFNVGVFTSFRFESMLFWCGMGLISSKMLYRE